MHANDAIWREGAVRVRSVSCLCLHSSVVSGALGRVLHTACRALKLCVKFVLMTTEKIEKSVLTLLSVDPPLRPDPAALGLAPAVTHAAFRSLVPAVRQWSNGRCNIFVRLACIGHTALQPSHTGSRLVSGAREALTHDLMRVRGPA